MLNPMVILARTEYVMLVMRVLIVTQKYLTHFLCVIPRILIGFFIFNCSFSFWMVWQYETT